MKKLLLTLALASLSSTAQAGYQFYSVCVANTGTVYETLRGGYAGSGSDREDLGEVPNTCLDRSISAAECKAQLHAIGQDGEEIDGRLRLQEDFAEEELADFDALVAGDSSGPYMAEKYVGMIAGKRVEILCSSSYLGFDSSPAKIKAVSEYGRRLLNK